MAIAMPTVFFGHGNPMNALSRNRFTDGWSSLGASLPKPRAVLCISAHWYVSSVALTVNTAPRTIHDFGGFPAELYRVQYPAPGDPILARRIQKLLSPLRVELEERWGLDHGTWSILRHVYPRADVPVVQLSINESKAAASHYEIGERLAPLREEGILIVGSGNLVHNLHAYAWGKHNKNAYDWAVAFEKRARELLLGQDHTRLIHYEDLGAEASLSIPTPDHYLPLLYVIGAGKGTRHIEFPVEGFDGGSISMLTVQIGKTPDPVQAA